MTMAPRGTRPGWTRWLEYIPAAAWAAYLLYLGSRTFDVPVLPYRFPIDKVAHFGLYGLLGALAANGWRRAGRWPAIWVPLILACGVGVLDELGQTRVITRMGDPLDFAADFVAIIAAFVIVGRQKTRQGSDED